MSEELNDWQGCATRVKIIKTALQSHDILSDAHAAATSNLLATLDMLRVERVTVSPDQLALNIVSYYRTKPDRKHQVSVPVSGATFRIIRASIEKYGPAFLEQLSHAIDPSVRGEANLVKYARRVSRVNPSN